MGRNRVMRKSRTEPEARTDTAVHSRRVRMPGRSNSPVPGGPEPTPIDRLVAPPQLGFCSSAGGSLRLRVPLRPTRRFRFGPVASWFRWISWSEPLQPRPCCTDPEFSFGPETQPLGPGRLVWRLRLQTRSLPVSGLTSLVGFASFLHQRSEQVEPVYMQFVLRWRSHKSLELNFWW